MVTSGTGRLFYLDPGGDEDEEHRAEKLAYESCDHPFGLWLKVGPVWGAFLIHGRFLHRDFARCALQRGVGATDRAWEGGRARQTISQSAVSECAPQTKRLEVLCELYRRKQRLAAGSAPLVGKSVSGTAASIASTGGCAQQRLGTFSFFFLGQEESRGSRDQRTSPKFGSGGGGNGWALRCCAVKAVDHLPPCCQGRGSCRHRAAGACQGGH